MSNKRTYNATLSEAATVPQETDFEPEDEAPAADMDAAGEARKPATPQRLAARGATQPRADVRADSLARNLFFCIGGLVLGFALGFFLANKLAVEPRPPEVSGAAQAADGPAPPLDPTQTTGELPPGHPDIGAAGGATAGSAAATSAEAQQAMAAADAQPKDFNLQMSAAALFYKASEFDQATIYLQRALALKPKDVDALTALGNTKYDQGDYAGAAEYYQRVLAIEPRNTDVQTDLGNSYFRRTPPDYQRAIAEYRKTLAIDAKHEKALQNIAAAALRLRDKATARTAIDQLAAANPNNSTLDSLREGLNALP